MYLLGPTFVFSGINKWLYDYCYLFISGHMGPYLPQHYSMFTVMDDLEWLERVTKIWASYEVCGRYLPFSSSVFFLSSSYSSSFLFL